MKIARAVLLGAVVTACAPTAQTPAADKPEAVLQAYVDAWNRHDSLAIDSLLGPTGVHEDFAWGFRGEGAAAVRAFMRDVIAVSPDYHWQVTSSFSDGQSVVGEWTWTATFTGPSPSGPVTNQHITGRGAAVAEIANGRIVRLSDYYDAASFFPRQVSDTADR
ncbi:MAG TPA: nuclear transport factor 2 family protein [Gemmatimonadales bacterium]|nr:nuclear transport factor 2 family protein [Gemmatimonadales bacterium]